MTPRNFKTSSLHLAAIAGLVSLALLSGCKSDEQKALDQAKQQAAATNTAQQIQYIDNNGDTVTTTVQPPVAGQPQQIVTNTTPPPPGPPPHHTQPVITSLSSNGQPMPVAAQPGTDPNAPQQMASAPAQPTAPPPPLQLTVPAGSELAIRINQNINVKHSHAGDRFSGEVVEPVLINGTEVVPRGTHVSGRVDESHRRGHFKGSSILELRLTSMTLNGNEYALDTHDNVRTKKGKGKRSSGFIAGMTGAGMIIGGVATGGVGLAIGGAAGAGAGTLIAGTTGNRDIDIPAESIVHFRLADDLVVQNP
jgi:hypothetical protein